MSKLLTVFGATGQQGGSLIDYVLKNPELSSMYRVRGITRDRSNPTAVALKARGVEVIEADLDKPATLIPALAGSYAVLGVTNCKFFHCFATCTVVSFDILTWPHHRLGTCLEGS